jgi:hypothetical protein
VRPSSNLYGKLVEQLKLAGQPVPGETDQSATGQPAPGLPRSWDDIAVGHLVLAEEEEEYYGWRHEAVSCRTRGRSGSDAARGMDKVRGSGGSGVDSLPYGGHLNSVPGEMACIRSNASR